MKLDINIASVESGSDLEILRMCRRMPKHAPISRVTCDLFGSVLLRDALQRSISVAYVRLLTLLQGRGLYESLSKLTSE